MNEFVILLISATTTPDKPQVGRVTPIIIVPSALTSFISMINIADFLLTGTYVLPEDKKKEPGAKVPLRHVFILCLVIILSFDFGLKL